MKPNEEISGLKGHQYMLEKQDFSRVDNELLRIR
jgi:hypothetical protein